MKIEIKAGPNAGQQHDIEGPTVVGRDPAVATLVIDDPEASRRHASLAPGGEGIVVEDLGSTNGTFVNGERVEGSRNAGAGDEIRIGNTVVEVQSTIEVTRMSPIPEASDPGATAIGSPVPDASVGAEPPAAEPAAGPPAPEPPAAEPPAPAVPEPAASGPPEPAAAEPPAPPPPPSFDQPTAEPPVSPQVPEPVASAPEPPAPPPPPPPGGAPPPPPGAGQGFGSPQQGFQQPQPGFGQPQMGPPGGPMVGYAPGPVATHESVVEWLLCIFVPFYNIYWIHRASKEMQAYSNGRIDYSAGATISALTIGAFVLVPPFVAIFSFGGRLRRAQEIAGVQPRASGIGFFGRLFLFGYGYKWAQDQMNEIATRPPQA